MSAPNYVTVEDVKAFIPADYWCFGCCKPLTHSMRASCCHHTCQKCVENNSVDAISFCALCKCAGTFAEDTEFSNVVRGCVEELLLEHCRAKLPLQLSPQLSVAFVKIGKRFVDAERLQVDLSRLTRELKDAQRSVDAGLVDTSDANFDFSSFATCTSAAELHAIKNPQTVVSLSVKGCWFTKLSDLTAFKNLRLLKLRWCSKLPFLAGIDRLKLLTHLVVEDCSVYGVWGVEKCRMLRHIEFVRCPHFNGLSLPTPIDPHGGSSDGSVEAKGVLRVVACAEFYALTAPPSSLQLKEFTATSTAFDDLTPLADCRALKELNLNGSKVTEITALAAHTHTLEKISLQRTGVCDIFALQSATKLEDVDLSETQVTDITALTACAPVLRKLDLRCTGVSDISVLQAATKLEEVYLYGAQVTDIAALTACAPVLRVLGLTNTGVSDISVLQAATKLERVYLGSTQVTDIAALTACAPVLRVLALENTGVSDISVLQQAVKLERVYLGSTQVKDTSFLSATVKINRHMFSFIMTSAVTE